MIQDISFTVFMVPVAKGRPKFSSVGGFSRAYTPKKTITAENNILAQSMPFKPAVPLQDWAAVSIRCFMPIPASFSKKDRLKAIGGEMRHTKKPDLDNLAKTCLDSLNGVFFRDDSIICALAVSKSYHVNPCVEISIQGE
jgi:Holliday junction resolvase RusA-like endonuclease